jgi:hypothetical protein
MRQQQAQEREQARQQGGTPQPTGFAGGDGGMPFIGQPRGDAMQPRISGGPVSDSMQQPQPSGGRGFDFGFDPTQPRISGGPVSDSMQPQMRTQPPAPNPYSQQVGQEDPRLQAMRNMSMMRF